MNAALNQEPEWFRCKVAFHEAAHAVALFHFGSVDRIELVDDPTRWAITIGDMPDDGGLLEKVVIKLSGPVTEWMIDPDDQKLFEYVDLHEVILRGTIASDIQEASLHASDLCDFDLDDESHRFESYFAWYWLAARTERLVTEWWSQIAAVAEEVFDHGTVTGDRIAAIVNRTVIAGRDGNGPAVKRPNVDLLVGICSPERPEPLYRYSYVRTRFPGRARAAVILFNPVHRGEKTDQTTGKCMTWLCTEDGIGEVEFVNLYAYRHPRPGALKALAEAGMDVVGPENDRHILAAIERSALVVVAWGGEARRVDASRASQVLSWVERPYCFGTNGDGSPAHPNRRGSNRLLRPLPYDGTG